MIEKRICDWWHGPQGSETGIPELDRLRRRDRRRNWGFAFVVLALVLTVGVVVKQNDTISDQNETIVSIVADEQVEIHAHRLRNEQAHKCSLEFDEAQQRWIHGIVAAFGSYVNAGEPVVIPPAPNEQCPEFINPTTGDPLGG